MDEREAVMILGRYIQRFRARSHQLNSMRIGGQWWDMRVPVGEAAQWANLGLLPEEAAPLIASGITPAMHREMEEHAEREAGGPEALMEQRIAQLVALGEIVDPAEVIRVQDPTDPSREIIAIRDGDE